MISFAEGSHHNLEYNYYDKQDNCEAESIVNRFMCDLWSI